MEELLTTFANDDLDDFTLSDLGKKSTKNKMYKIDGINVPLRSYRKIRLMKNRIAYLSKRIKAIKDSDTTKENAAGYKSLLVELDLLKASKERMVDSYKKCHGRYHLYNYPHIDVVRGQCKACRNVTTIMSRYTVGGVRTIEVEEAWKIYEANREKRHSFKLARVNKQRMNDSLKYCTSSFHVGNRLQPKMLFHRDSNICPLCKAAAQRIRTARKKGIVLDNYTAVEMATHDKRVSKSFIANYVKLGSPFPILED